MNREQFGGYENKEEEHEGERYLRLLGMEDFAEHEITTTRGTIQTRDFLDICGDHARPVLKGIEARDPEDPQRMAAISALQTMVIRYIEGNN